MGFSLIFFSNNSSKSSFLRSLSILDSSTPFEGPCSSPKSITNWGFWTENLLKKLPLVFLINSSLFFGISTRSFSCCILSSSWASWVSSFFSGFKLLLLFRSDLLKLVYCCFCSSFCWYCCREERLTMEGDTLGLSSCASFISSFNLRSFLSKNSSIK